MTGPPSQAARPPRPPGRVINPDAVGATTAPVISTWTSKDAALYALGVGAGIDPSRELFYTTDNSEGMPQRVLPTFAVVPSFPCFAGGTALDEVGAFDRGM